MLRILETLEHLFKLICAKHQTGSLVHYLHSSSPVARVVNNGERHTQVIKQQVSESDNVFLIAHIIYIKKSANDQSTLLGFIDVMKKSSRRIL